jgi:hypothetical protein
MMTDDDDPILQALHDAVKLTREMATKAEATATAVLRNEMKTLPQRHRESRVATFALLEKATLALDGATKAAQSEIAAINAKVKGPASAKDLVGETKQREMRERLSMLSEDRRKTIIGNAIASNDEVLICAILSAPAWLSGLTDPELSLHRNNWASKHFSADLDRVGRLSRAVEDTRRAGSLAIQFISNLTDAALVDKAEAMERQANDALARAAVK